MVGRVSAKLVTRNMPGMKASSSNHRHWFLPKRNAGVGGEYDQTTLREMLKGIMKILKKERICQVCLIGEAVLED